MRKVRSPLKKKYGELTVVKVLDSTWVACKCSCGAEAKVRSCNLRSGSTSSCGCFRKKRMGRIGKKFGGMMKTHGMSGNGLANKPPTYSSWVAMRDRCRNPRRPKAYAGVFACSFLLASPENLIAVIGERPNRDVTLDRFPECQGNYTCGTCSECKKNGWEKNIRWTTYAEQSENRECVLPRTAFGRTMSLVRWAKETGMHPATLRYRIVVKGQSLERALSTPNRSGYCYQGKESDHSVL